MSKVASEEEQDYHHGEETVGCLEGSVGEGKPGAWGLQFFDSRSWFLISCSGPYCGPEPANGVCSCHDLVFVFNLTA